MEAGLIDLYSELGAYNIWKESDSIVNSTKDIYRCPYICRGVGKSRIATMNLRHGTV